MESDLQFLEVGPIVHSRCLTLANRILRYYVSLEKPSANLLSLVEFCIMVYFPSLFEIKLKNKLNHASKTFFNFVQRIAKLLNKEVSERAIKVKWMLFLLIKNMFYVQCWLGDREEEIRRLVSTKSMHYVESYFHFTLLMTIINAVMFIVMMRTIWM